MRCGLLAAAHAFASGVPCEPSASPSPATRHAALSFSRLDRRTSLTSGSFAFRYSNSFLYFSSLPPFPRPSYRLPARRGPPPCSFLPLYSAKLRDDELVDRIGQQQHFLPLGPERFQVRRMLDQLAALADQVVDLLLLGRHRLDVLRQRGELARLGSSSTRTAADRPVCSRLDQSRPTPFLEDRRPAPCRSTTYLSYSSCLHLLQRA